MNLQNGIFTEEVENDITLFAKDARRKRVLIFPPVNNYRRFLIHQLVQENFARLLTTFSIGQGSARRTVVCYQSDVISDPKLNGVPSRIHNESKNSFKSIPASSAMGVEKRSSPSPSPEHARTRQVKSAPAVEIYRPPAARRASRNETAQSIPSAPVTETSSSSAKSNRQRRPDRAVYVPKQRRSTEADDGFQNPEEIVPTARSRSSRPRRSSLSGSDVTRKLSSPTDVHDNGPGPSGSWNKEFSTNSKPLCYAELCDNIGEKLERVSRSQTVTDVHLHSTHVQEDNTVITGNEFGVSVKTEIVESCMKTNDLESMQTISRSLSVSSDEIVNSLTRRDEVSSTASSISRDRSDDEQTVNDPRRNSDVDVIRECSSSLSSSSSSSSSNHEGNRSSDVPSSRRQSVDNDEHANNKNLQSFGSSVLPNVLIISDTKRATDDKDITIEKRILTDPIRAPEKKAKKVARTKSKPASPPSPPVKLNRDECDWDSLFDDNGECLDPTLIEELTAAVGDVTIEQPRNDYKAFTRTVEVSSDEFGHVVEIYNFPSDFKTSDLAAVFSPWKNGGFELKWVDDTHCLGVFSSPLVAAEVLASDHPFVKTRPLSAATALSKTKARRSAEFLQPYRSRPETCAALARRLVTGALGVKLATARQEREQEKVLLREAKEKRRLANKQREDVWEGIIAEK